VRYPPATASAATHTLTMELLAAAARGDKIPCGDWSVSHLFLSEDKADRQIAIRLCHSCPVFNPCREVGRHQTFGVFGGVDVTRTPGRKKVA
jgi:Transcription factor WhiB